MVQSQKHSKTMVHFSKDMLSNKQKGNENTSWELMLANLLFQL